MSGGGGGGDNFEKKIGIYFEVLHLRCVSGGGWHFDTAMIRLWRRYVFQPTLAALWRQRAPLRKLPH